MISDFNKLWSGQTTSAIGNAVTRFALPTVAIFTIHATPLQIGEISALGMLPFPILGMLVGVLADRFPRRLILIASDALRFAALLAISIAACFGALNITQLYTVALVTGIGSVFFGITYQSYLPSLVPTGDLPHANAKLEFSDSGSAILGTAISGVLVQWLGAALAFTLDAMSYLVSIATLAFIRTKEEQHSGPSLTIKQLAIELREGIDCVFRSNNLRCVVGATATTNLGCAMAISMNLLYAYRVLHLQPGIVGVVLGFAAFGFVGALLSSRVRALFGLRVTLFGSLLLLACGMASILLARIGLPYVALFASSAIGAVAATVYNINQVSYRQSIVETRLQGRMNATIRTIAWGIMPLGSLLGGFLGNAVGIEPTIAVGAIVTVAGAFFILPMRERASALAATEA